LNGIKLEARDSDAESLPHIDAVEQEKEAEAVTPKSSASPRPTVKPKQPAVAKQAPSPSKQAPAPSKPPAPKPVAAQSKPKPASTPPKQAPAPSKPPAPKPVAAQPKPKSAPTIPKQVSPPSKSVPAQAPPIKGNAPPRCGGTGQKQKTPSRAAKSTKKGLTTCVASNRKTKRDILTPAKGDDNAVDFRMNQGPTMATFKQNQNPHRTIGLAGCTVAIIASAKHSFAIHVSRGIPSYQSSGAPKLDAEGNFVFENGQDEVGLAQSAATQLVALWNANRETGVMYSSMILTADFYLVESGDPVAWPMWQTINAAVGGTTIWNTYNVATARGTTPANQDSPDGILRIWESNIDGGLPLVQLGTTPICMQW
jgi:hypothetical protein